jgi:hypothetical protein
MTTFKMAIDIKELHLMQDLMEFGWDNAHYKIEDYLVSNKLNSEKEIAKILKLFRKYPNAYRSNERAEDQVNTVRKDIIQILEDLKDSEVIVKKKGGRPADPVPEFRMLLEEKHRINYDNNKAEFVKKFKNEKGKGLAILSTALNEWYFEKKVTNKNALLESLKKELNIDQNIYKGFTDYFLTDKIEKYQIINSHDSLNKIFNS